MISFSRLEDRLKYSIPEEYHEDIEREIAKFGTEISRMSLDEEKIGQATLTDREIEKIPTTNQNGENGFTVVEAQCIKAAAIKYEVNDWISKVDSKLTYEENIEIMKNEGNGETLRNVGGRRGC